MSTTTDFRGSIALPALRTTQKQRDLSVFRQLMLLAPIFRLLSRFGLNCCWFAFVITELIVTAVSYLLYRKQTAKWRSEKAPLPMA